MENEGLESVTVLMVSDRLLLLATLTAGLLRQPGIELHADLLTEPAQLPQRVALRLPAVLLLDKALLDGLDERALRALREACPATRVLLVDDEYRPGPVIDVLRHGFHGLLLATDAPSVCLKAVRAVARGELWLSRAALASAIALLLPDHFGGNAHAVPAGRTEEPSRLTPREVQIVELVRRGCSNKEIALALGVVEDTVKKHLQSVFGKLGVRRRALVALSSPHPAYGTGHGPHAARREAVIGSAAFSVEMLSASARGGHSP
jgi:DNA-binding NarL/FixJ family response regulator